MPICVTGMPKSGLSMVAAGLEAAGVRLLPPESGLAGISEAVLDAAGGAWDMPPDLPPDWELSHAMTGLRIRAATIYRELDATQPLAWVDPSAGLIVPFWRGLLPDLRLVVCVRNPLEVVRSMARDRALSDRLGAHLWCAHVRGTTGGPPASWRVVTHYESHLESSEAELRRVMRDAGIEPTADALAAAAGVPRRDRRHQIASAEETLDWADRETVELYLRVCAASGPQLHAALAGAGGEDGEIETLAVARELDVLRRARADAEAGAAEARREVAEIGKRHIRRVQLLRKGRDKARDDAARHAAEFEQQLAAVRAERDEARAETLAVVKRRDALRRELDALEVATAKQAAQSPPLVEAPPPPVVSNGPTPGVARGAELVPLSPTQSMARRTWRSLPQPARRLLEPAAVRVRRRLQGRAP